MMAWPLRVLLIAGAFFILVFVLNKIRRNQLFTSDAVFWFLFSACLVIAAIFPQIIYWLTALLGVESPANLVFLLVLAILIFKMLVYSVEVAHLRLKMMQLAEHVAIREYDIEIDENSSSCN